jgi:4-hydroxy-4-methyl-2-oxoglutarate aldolase
MADQSGEVASVAVDHLPAAAVADAVIRLGRPIRLGPPSIGRLVPGEPVVGRAVPTRHTGSVDVFLEALETAAAGDVLVIDNGGRDDEGCIGDLIVAETKAAGLAGIVVWGRHRDSIGLRRLGLPIWSTGACPFGPHQLRPVPGDRLEAADIGDVRVSSTDIVVADDDGVLFVSDNDWDAVSAAAAGIVRTEERQAVAIGAGTSLRIQLDVAGYLARKAADPTYTFRQHLRTRGGAVEV